MMLRKLLYFGLFCSVFIISCDEEVEPLAPNVSSIDPKFEWIRFDKELFSLDTNNVRRQARTLEKKYSAFSEIYFNNILLLSPENKYLEIEGFLKDHRIRQLQDTTEMILDDLQSVKDELYKSFQYYQYYFPDRDVPNLYTFISEYSYQSFVFEEEVGQDGVGLGLDMFLGNDYPYRNIIPNNEAFSEYLTRAFNKEHMAKKVMESLVDDIMGSSKGNTLLDKMIHNGKKIFILDKLMPFVSDTLIMEYTKDQLDWCYDNEIQMWGYLFSENLFYSNDIKKINKLINPSPHSSGMPSEAPGRTANFIGWQIIIAYMKRHPDISLMELLRNLNAQEILEESKYKPRSR
jgi:hypothetical protein